MFKIPVNSYCKVIIFDYNKKKIVFECRLTSDDSEEYRKIIGSKLLDELINSWYVTGSSIVINYEFGER